MNPAFPRFTPRELELIKMFSTRGMYVKEAAWELHLSPKTVDTHRQNIIRKIKDSMNWLEFQRITKTDLVLFALANGLVEPEAVYAKYVMKP